LGVAIGAMVRKILTLFSKLGVRGGTWAKPTPSVIISPTPPTRARPHTHFQHCFFCVFFDVLMWWCATIDYDGTWLSSSFRYHSSSLYEDGKDAIDFAKGQNGTVSDNEFMICLSDLEWLVSPDSTNNTSTFFLFEFSIWQNLIVTVDDCRKHSL
jgi:hypothetical protein